MPSRARLLADRVLAERVSLRARGGYAAATRIEDSDVGLLAETGTIVATCPTAKGGVGDGHFPALRYRDAGVRIAIGSDSNVLIDPFEEVRELETGARREGLTRHALLAEAGDLWRAVAENGARLARDRGRRRGHGGCRPPAPARGA